MSASQDSDLKAQKKKEKRQRQKKKHEHAKELATQVLGTTELLENVLLHLPLKDLLFAQAVSRTWKTVIDKSPDLQKALFFQPATSEVVFWAQGMTLDYKYDGHRRSMPYPNLLSEGSMFYRTPSDGAALNIVEKFVDRGVKFVRALAAEIAGVQKSTKSSRLLKQNIQDRDDLRRIAIRTKVYLNPLLLSRFFWFHEFFVAVDQAPLQFYKIDLQNDLDLKPSARRSEASWRRMLISQPPLAAISARIDGKSAWNILGKDGWGKPINMGLLRTKMALASGYELEINGTDKFKIWRDGDDLKKIKMTRTTLENEANNVDTDTDSDDSDDYPPVPEEGKGKAEDKGGENNGAKKVGPHPGWVPRMTNVAGGKGLVLF